MLEVINKTPHHVALIPFTDKGGMDHAGVVIKGTWSIGTGADPPLAEEQQPVLPGDLRNGDGPEATLRYAADLGWPKLATDVVLVGHAHTRNPRGTEVDVGLAVGPLRKVVRVFGERVWYRSLVSWEMTKPRPFERMPLVYERAYGGRDTTHADPRKHGWEQRNPAGRGFAVAAVAERMESLPLPNLEDPARLISSWKDRPGPAGFGFIEGFWEPRARFAGTYGKDWEATRAPLLPDDFDERFLNAAHPDLSAKGHLVGGEPAMVTNADPTGQLVFRLPRRKFSVTAVIKGKTAAAEPRLDTVFIDADRRELVMVWRAALPCPRCFLAIKAIFVKEARA